MILLILSSLVLVLFGYITYLNRKLGSLKQDNEVLNTTIRVKNEQLKIAIMPDVDKSTLVERMRKGGL